MDHTLLQMQVLIISTIIALLLFYLVLRKTGEQHSRDSVNGSEKAAAAEINNAIKMQIKGNKTADPALASNNSIIPGIQVDGESLVTGITRMFVSTFYVSISENTVRTVSSEYDEDVLAHFTQNSYDDFLNEYVKEYVHPDDHDSVLELCGRGHLVMILDKRNSFYYITIRHKNSSGKYVWYKLHVMLSKLDDKNQCDSIILAFMDVNSEVEMEKLYQKKLEKANSIKTEFLSNMSHDIRTPLNGIIGMTTVAMSNTDNSEKLEECLNKIDYSSRYLLTILSDMLDMSMLEAGVIEIADNEIILSELIESFSRIMLPYAKECLIDLSFNVDVVNDYVRTDEMRLVQILRNLVDNGLKFTPEGGSVAVEVKQLESEDEGIANIAITVSDNGCGIQPEFIDTIFEAFARERTGAVSTLQGTGLGLAISKGLIEMMGGYIDVESTPGEGSVFTMYVPMLISDRNADNMSSEFMKITDNGNLLSGLRVLVAEDNEINMIVMEQILTSENMIMVPAENGRIALEKFTEAEPGTFDFILMDIQMPEMNGYDASINIRRSGKEDAGYIPIIAVSADAFAEDVERALRSGMNAHIAKPVDFEKLLGTMRDIRIQQKMGTYEFM